MDKTKNKITGNKGERIAADYLEDKGYKILERNYELFIGEIDILVDDGKVLVIVEVKTVRGSAFGPAKGYVGPKKQKKLRDIARAVTQEYPKRTIRIDVVGIDLSDEENPIIEHIENAVEN